MRYAIIVLLTLCTAFSSAFAAAKKSGTPASEDAAEKVDKDEKIYWEEDVIFDQGNEFAREKFTGEPITGTVQIFYPNGRLAWMIQWVDGKLHGITRGYYPNRRLKEETTWVDGKLNGQAKWYDEKGNMRRTTLYENGEDLAAPTKNKDEIPAESTGSGEAAENSTENPEKKPEDKDGTENLVETSGTP